MSSFDAGQPRFRSHVTLALCTVLHAFTHAYGTLLVPLYLLMAGDLHLRGVSAASAVVTVYGIVYCLGSYAAGTLADRTNRSVLLGVGLIGNALAIAAMGLTRRYEVIMLCGILAGVFGTIFHPAANALVPAHYPRSPAMAIGILGIGAGIGFFAGPRYAGWRAESDAWQWTWGTVAAWQRPLVEAGIAGVVVGVLFLLLAREVRGRNGDNSTGNDANVARGVSRRAGGIQRQPPQPVGAALRGKIFWLALILGCRDFAGIATISLGSIYLQKAHRLDAAQAGFILGTMMLISIVINPFAIYFSAGSRRLPVLAGVLIAGGAVIATVPLWPVRVVLPVLMVFMAFQLGSYALSDAAMLERVAPPVRGRVVGLFITVAGTISSASPLVMGWWTDHLGPSAADPRAYLPLFGTLGALMMIAAASTRVLRTLGEPQLPAIEPISQTSPVTIEPAM